MTLRRVINWIVGLPIAIIAIGFAVANRQWTTISFDPFTRDAPFASITLPLWAILFCGVFLGLIIGWTAAWFAHAKWRKAAREARIELAREQAEQSRALTNQ